MATMKGGKKFSGAYGGKKENPFAKPIKDIDKKVARKIEKNVKKSFKKNK
ncbi:MAG: hypothetical protein ACR2M7_04270 [Bdellovibrionales bacterium]